MTKILFLASGNGGTMKFLHQAIRLLDLDYCTCGVISDRKCGSTLYSVNNNIPTFIFDKWRSQTDSIVAKIVELNPDIVVTNIFKILPSSIFNCCNATFINLHYSLLPAFGGVIGFKTLEMAKAVDTKIIGATCHYVTEEVDAGKVISQAAIPVDWNEDINLIGNKIFRIACESILNALLLINGENMGESYNTRNIIYSPCLLYDNRVFDENFWTMIRSL